jgi:hypothetical protein
MVACGEDFSREGETPSNSKYFSRRGSGMNVITKRKWRSMELHLFRKEKINFEKQKTMARP